jgi:hypothetical protein
MTAQDVKRMGCLSEEKQCKYNRKRCKYFVTNTLLISIEERVEKKEVLARCAE